MGSFNMMARESYFEEMIFYLIPKIHNGPTMQHASKRESQVKGIASAECGDWDELVMVKEDQIDI